MRIPLIITILLLAGCLGSPNEQGSSDVPPSTDEPVSNFTAVSMLDGDGGLRVRFTLEEDADCTFATLSQQVPFEDTVDQIPYIELRSDSGTWYLFVFGGDGLRSVNMIGASAEGVSTWPITQEAMHSTIMSEGRFATGQWDYTLNLPADSYNATIVGQNLATGPQELTQDGSILIGTECTQPMADISVHETTNLHYSTAGVQTQGVAAHAMIVTARMGSTEFSLDAPGELIVNAYGQNGELTLTGPTTISYEFTAADEDLHDRRIIPAGNYTQDHVFLETVGAFELIAASWHPQT